MATGRKGSTSKAGGVRFPDDDEPPGSPTRRDDQSNLSTLIAIQEKDGSYLVKAGFLKSHHCYEIVFTILDVPTLGKELSCLPSSSPTRRYSSLQVHRINSTIEGGVKVTCEYRTHQEGVLQEEITLVTRGRKDRSLKVKLQARVIDPHHGTPMLLEGVRCLGAHRDAQAKHHSSDRKRERDDDLDGHFMAVACLTAQRSKDLDTQVGACIVNQEGKVVGIGYNCMPNDCEDDLPWERGKGNWLEKKYAYVCLAELNAFINRFSADVKGCTMFLSLFPCNECAKLIIQAGIKEVVYLADKNFDRDYLVAAKRMLDIAKIETVKFKPKRTQIIIDFNDFLKDDQAVKTQSKGL